MPCNFANVTSMRSPTDSMKPEEMMMMRHESTLLFKSCANLLYLFNNLNTAAYSM